MSPPSAPRPEGTVTRGTTAPNRLRRVDRWILHARCSALRAAADPYVVDLGYGAHPVTTLELHDRLARHVRGDIQVVGLEIDPERVAAAVPLARAGVGFRRGGFELPGPPEAPARRPALVRAMNVLRQYDEAQVRPAWRRMVERLAPGGVLVEGTCDEQGRRVAVVALHADDPRDAAGDPVPRTLTLSAHLASLERPSDLAERLPKALIHRNLPGERVHDVLGRLDRAWSLAAPHGVFGPRARWLAAVQLAVDGGLEVADDRRRWRLGELTVPWSAVAPVA